jgi:hypothetical protein
MPEGSFLNYLDQPTAGQDPNTRAAPPAATKKPQQAPSLLDHFLDHFVASAATAAPSEPKEEAKPTPSLLDRFLDSFGETEQAAQRAHPEFGQVETTAPPAPPQDISGGQTPPLEMPERTEGTLAQRALDPQGMTKAGALAMQPGMIGRGPGIADPGFRARTEPLPAGQVPGIADLARGVGHAIEATLSPTTVDTGAGMAEASIRKSLGEARRDTAVSNAAFTNNQRKLIAPMVGPFQEYVQLSHQARANAMAAGVPYQSNLPKPDALEFIDYIEGRSAGAALPGHLQHLQPVANALRNEMKQRATAIAADPLTDVSGFIDNYYSHQWREKPNAQTFLSGTRPRMGSGAPLKRRTIPTLSEGIEQGLTPTSFDPIETSMRYIANMDRFLASARRPPAGRRSRAASRGRRPTACGPTRRRVTRGSTTAAPTSIPECPAAPYIRPPTWRRTRRHRRCSGSPAITTWRWRRRPRYRSWHSRWGASPKARWRKRLRRRALLRLPELRNSPRAGAYSKPT